VIKGQFLAAPDFSLRGSGIRAIRFKGQQEITRGTWDKKSNLTVQANIQYKN